MARGRVRRILFRIFYSTTFTIVFLLTVAFASAGPIDMLYQSYRRGRLIDMFILGGAYFLTALLALFLYASRMYTNRSVLKDIPKTYMPIDKGELPGRRLWRLVEDCKNRSAVIAYLAKPRSRRIEVEVGYARSRINTLLRPEHSKQYRMFEPQWGEISHPGWSSPAAVETPNLDYSAVVAELRDLIEARAVSLAPVDGGPARTAYDMTTPDEDIIEALRRPEEAGMRQYIAQLTSLDVLEDSSLVFAFLALYERARFAPTPLSEEDFNSLMRMFAEILRTMRTLDTTRMDNINSDRLTREADLGDPKLSQSLYKHPRVAASTSSLASSIAGSVRHNRIAHGTNYRLPSFATAVPRISHDSVRSMASEDGYADAQNKDISPQPKWASPTSRPPFFRARSSKSRTSTQNGSRHRHRSPHDIRSRRRRSRLGRMASRNSLESNATGQSSLSLRSLRSARSNGSVIRLNPDFERSGELPYRYTN